MEAHCECCKGRRNELQQARAKLDEQDAELTDLRNRVAQHDAERAENLRAAQELQAAFKEYLDLKDARGVEQKPKQRAAVQDSWDDLQKRVAQKLDGVTRQASSKLAHATPRSRLSSTRLFTPRAAQQGNTPAQQDPVGELGAVGELVAAVARERQARQAACVPETESTVVTVSDDAAKDLAHGSIALTEPSQELHTPQVDTQTTATSMFHSPLSVDSVPLRNGYTPVTQAAEWAQQQQQQQSGTDVTANAHGSSLSIHTNHLALQPSQQLPSQNLTMASGTASPSLSPSQSPQPSARTLGYEQGAGVDADGSARPSTSSRDGSSSSPNCIPALHDDAAAESKLAAEVSTASAASAASSSVWDRAYVSGRSSGTHSAGKGMPARQGSSQLPFGRASRTGRTGSQAGCGPSVSRRPVSAKAQGKGSGQVAHKAWA